MDQVSRQPLEEKAAEGKLEGVRAALKELGQLLRSDALEGLVAGFDDLTHPHLRLTDWLKEWSDLVRRGKKDEAKALFVKRRAETLGPKKRNDPRGKLLLAFAEAFRSKLDNALGPDGKKGAALQPKARSQAWRGIVAEGGNWRFKGNHMSNKSPNMSNKKQTNRQHVTNMLQNLPCFHTFP